MEMFRVPGYEYGNDHNRAPQERAWERVKALDLSHSRLVARVERDYNTTIVTLDPSLTLMLDPLERAVFAARGLLPFGGSVTNNVVSIMGND